MECRVCGEEMIQQYPEFEFGTGVIKKVKYMCEKCGTSVERDKYGQLSWYSNDDKLMHASHDP